MKKFILGIDFGHGETAASFIRVTDKLLNNGEADVSPEVAQIMSNTHIEERKLPSVIMKDKYGKYGTNLLDSELFISFKSKIDPNSPHSKYQVFESFIKIVFEMILENHHEFTEDGSQLSVYIASPTMWDNEDKSNYKKFVSEAIGKDVEWIISESDAAYFSKKSQGATVVIDYGSSTIDYTLVVDNKKIDIDVQSNDYGARGIENTLLNIYKDSIEYITSIQKANEELARTGYTHIDIDSLLTYELRKIKETAYTNSSPYLMLYLDLSHHFSKCNSVEFNYKYGRFELLLNDYKSLIMNDFRLLKDEISTKLGERKLDNIILSGGASIMPWVSDSIQTIFGNEVRLIKDSNPSFVVSEGIVKYAVAQEKAKCNIMNYLSDIDFFKIYEKCDNDATNKSIQKLIPSVLNEYSSSSTDYAATVLHDMLLSFFLGLTDNEQYLHIFRSSFNSLLGDKVNSILQDTMKEVFSYSLNEAVTISLPDVPIIPFTEPKMKETIKDWIKRASNQIWFRMGKPRSKDKREQLSDNILAIVEELYLTYSNEDSTQEVGELIKEQVMEKALQIFNEKQLFRTI